MPELPEVETTIRSLNRNVRGLQIANVWSNYFSDKTAPHKKNESIKNLSYFERFKKAVTGKKIINVERRAKNVLINLNSGITILVHMKMTGHFLFGIFAEKEEVKSKKLKVKSWIPVEKTGALNVIQ